MIKSLVLNNFKKHAHAEFTFTEGLNGIFGPNYTGKTTILYAILYALGGASHVPGTNIQKKGTNLGLSVVMEFDVGGMDYRVERKKSGAYLYDNEGMIASGTSNVTKKIEELLGMPIKRFRQLKYAEQKKAHALLSIGATELHKILEELTGLDQINNAMEKLKSIVSSASGALEVLSHEDTKDLEKSEVEYKDLVSVFNYQVKDIVKDKEAADKNYAALLEDTANRLEQYNKWREWSAEKNLLSAAEEIHKSSIASLTSKADISIDFEKRKYKIDKAEENVGGLDNSLSKMKADAMTAKQMESELKGLDDFVDKTEKLVARGERDLQEMPESLCQDSLDKAEGSMEKQREDAALSQLKYSNILNLFTDSKCPTCDRDYEGFEEVTKEQVDNYESLCEEANYKFKKMRGEFRNLRTGLSVKVELENDLRRNLEAMAEAVVDRRGKLEAASEFAKISNLKADPVAAAREIREKRHAISEMRTEYSRQKDYHDLLVDERGKLEDCTATLEKLVEPEYDSGGYDEAQCQMSKSITIRNELSDELIEKSKHLSGAVAELTSCKDKLTRLKEDNHAYDQANKRLSTAKALQKYLRDNRDRYTGEIWDYFLGSASTFVEACTNGAITKISRSEDGKFFFEEEGHAMSMSDASGAQEAIMGISVQLALAQATQCPLDILLVDEPTADMDAEHSIAVAGMLATKGSQVITISHREMDASVCNNVILMGESV